MDRKIVLLIDDSPRDRDLYGSVLWYNGFDVLVAEDAREGMRLATERNPDLILLDLVLPDESGLDLCERLKADCRSSGIPVIAVSGHAAGDYKRPAERAGCCDYVEKPTSPLQLLRIVETWIGRARREARPIQAINAA